MSGIYIHVPFCRKKCIYCDFYSVGARAGGATFTKLLVQELVFRKNYLNEGLVETIYFGGGTPSVLNVDEVSSILRAIATNFSVSANAEVTFEANPDDLSIEYLLTLKKIGVNRLSIGIQSFSDSDLTFLGRRHDAQSAMNAIQMAKLAGFENISIDLIYGIPASSNETWAASLTSAIKLNVQHLSCYHLTFEPSTALYRRWQKGTISQVPEEQSVQQFNILRELALKNGFEHYEVSNLCLPGFQSKHNAAYWTGTPYLGLGPSAHSYNGASRCWNTSSLAAWAKGIEQGNLSSTKEVLTDREKLNEILMVSLRTSRGVDLKKIAEHFGDGRADRIWQIAKKYADNGSMVFFNDSVRIEASSFFIVDSIVMDFFEPE